MFPIDDLIITPASECGATSFFLAFFLDDMQRGDKVGAINVGVYITGYAAAVVWTRLGRCTRRDQLFSFRPPTISASDI